ncbi:MAG: hypothetical protein ACI85F_000206, partial [Bacteroidia bacterium]
MLISFMALPYPFRFLTFHQHGRTFQVFFFL